MKSRQQKHNINAIMQKSDFEIKIPNDIQKHVFSFFSQKELRNIAQSNKTFQQLSKEEIDRLKIKYKDNIFYTVGNPIHISNPKRRVFVDMDLWMKHREEIPNSEIFESFLGKNIQKVRLFKTEHEALEYSRFLRTGDQLEGTEVYQPAIFKVIYLGDTNNIDEYNEDLVINRGCGSSATEFNERITKVNYFDTARDNVIALEGTLKIHLTEIGEFKTHGPIDYSNLDSVEENTSSFSLKNTCAIS